MRSKVAGLVVVIGLGTVVGAGCDGSGDDETGRDAEVYVAAIRDVLAGQPGPEDPDVLPVVYVVAVGESEIPADIQADVAADLDGDADIRFADERSEAVLEHEDHMPVRNDGVLLAVGPVPADTEPVHMDVEIYRSDDDWSKVELTIARGSSQWTVTSSVPLPDNDN